MNTRILMAQPLTAAAFVPFGQVLDLDASSTARYANRLINGGNARRFDVVPDLQLTADGGVPSLAIFQAQARRFPLAIEAMERHALGSQTFVPLGRLRFVVVVAAATSGCTAADLLAFVTNGQQGIVLAPGTWHHALLAVEGGNFVVIERSAPHVDCEVRTLTPPVPLQLLR